MGFIWVVSPATWMPARTFPAHSCGSRVRRSPLRVQPEPVPARVPPPRADPRPGRAVLTAGVSPVLAKKKKVQPVAVSSVGVGPANMRTVNQRWAGSRAIIRVPAVVQKGKDKQGWSSSEWLPAPRLPGEREVKFRIWVSDREAPTRRPESTRSKPR